MTPNFKIYAALVLLTCGGATAQTCNVTNGGVTPTVRGEGLSELVGDIVIVCTGGTAVTSGNALPRVNITVSLNTPVTSRLLDSTNGSEALLLVDEPNSDLLGAPTTQLACPTPITGCPIVSNGAEPYDGSTGHPNVFQGIVSGNTVTFFGVPYSNPGNYGVGTIGFGPGTRVFRITNLRANVAALYGQTGPVTAAISGGLPQIVPNSLSVAFVNLGLIYRYPYSQVIPLIFPNCVTIFGNTSCSEFSLSFQEAFAEAFKIRLQGTAQNNPGAIYDSESGFYSPGLAASSANLATAGLADAGTRLKADFHLIGVPAGAKLLVPLHSAGSAGATLIASESGPFSAVPQSGPVPGFALLNVTNGEASAVWEITSANSAAIDTALFDPLFYFPPGVTLEGFATVTDSFAPNSVDGAFPANAANSAQNATLPVPRFTGAPPAILPPNQVITSASGLAYSRASQTFDGFVTISNISPYPISEPLQILFPGLPADVTLVNATGNFAGVPYLTIGAVGETFLAGQSFNPTVIFKNPSNAIIHLTPVICSGSFN